MTRDERLRCIDEELKGLWPQWDPTEAEIRVWLDVLGRYTYDVARTALQQVFCQQAGHYHRPKPAAFLAKARLLAGHVAHSRDPPRRPQTHLHPPRLPTERPRLCPNLRRNRAPTLRATLRRPLDHRHRKTPTARDASQAPRPYPFGSVHGQVYSLAPCS